MLLNIAFWLAKERFEYLPFRKELKEQTNIAKKQYQGLDKAFTSNKNNKNVNKSLNKKEPAAKIIAMKK